jgi:hypothetical protein
MNVALPTIGRDLHFSESGLQCVVTAHGLTLRHPDHPAALASPRHEISPARTDLSAIRTRAGAVMALARDAGLRALADEHLSVPTDKGANAGLKACSLVAGMVAGADSIDDMALLRHGGMGRVFDACYAPSTLGSFLCAFAFGHVRQLDAVASRLLTGLAARTPVVAGLEGQVLVDIDDTIIEVHGHAKQGAGFGYTKVRGLNALLVTARLAKRRR